MATQKPFLCPICGAYLHCFDRLQRHKYRHKMKYKEVETKWRSHLTESMHRPENRKEESTPIGTHTTPYQCETCYECFPSTSVLDDHLRSHIKKGPYQCEHCQKCFAQASTFKIHIRTHTKEKPYHCEHCKKCFARKSYLISHMRTHTKEKPYRCEHCQKCFAHWHILKNHIRTHTNEKPYQW